LNNDIAASAREVAMFESKEELIEKIRNGEDGLLELKEVRFSGGGSRVLSPARESIAEEFAAFANSHGGVCVFGVEDTPREIQGLSPDQLDGIETFVREICFDVIKPPLAVRIEKLSLPRTDGTTGAVVRVDIPRSLFVHEAPAGYFHRIGSSKRRMTPEFLARLFQQRSQARIIRFDEQAVPDAQLSDLEKPLWERFRTSRTRDDEEDFLTKLAMIRTDEDGAVRPTVCGILMATKAPSNWLPNAYIQAVAYAGTTVVPTEDSATYQIDAKDIKGSLDQQVMEACKFVVRNMSVAAVKDTGRHDLPQYDLTAVFEALVNAVAHRDYAIHGSKIRLRMFHDRLELYSPGAIPNTMTVGSMPYRQAARNEAITSLLAKCPVPTDIDWLQSDRGMMMDRRGEGVSIILERSEHLSGKKAEFTLIDDTELLLTIYSANALSS
jgi:ATP-dependent DNA helicase RecG